ncbi:hypothetical protein PS2_007446 [Malus domestica]
MAEESLVNPEGESSRVVPLSFLDSEVNTNQRLCSVLLNELNYLPWSRAVSLALGGKGKLGFINGSVETPDSSSLAYEAWLCKDQFVMSLLLNTMEKHVAEIFSYSESSQDLWKSVKDMYGNQNNYARVFQLKRDIACLQQEKKSFVQHLGSLKTMWNELDVYLPHTTDPTILLKRAEEDKIYQLLASLSSEYEDLRSHILMSMELPPFKIVCATVQREEARRRVMNMEPNLKLSETRGYVANRRSYESKAYKGRNPHLKCKYCNATGHTEDRCWELHPELKPKYNKTMASKPSSTVPFKAQHAAHNAISSLNHGLVDFTANPVTLINEFAAYLQAKNHGEAAQASTGEGNNHTALLGKFAGFLADHDHVSQDLAPGIFKVFSTALQTSIDHDC